MIQIQRKESRHLAGLPVFVFFSILNPFKMHKAILLDVGWEGFKIQLNHPQKLKSDQHLRIIIHLPKEFENALGGQYIPLKITTKWFDTYSQEFGGLIEMPQGKILERFEKLIQTLAKRLQKDENSWETGSPEIDISEINSQAS